jgi:hypothetical protein
VDYGAVADNGVTDNTAAFRAAVAAVNVKIGGFTGNATRIRGIVYVPGAKLPYVTSEPIRIWQSNIAIQGDPSSSQIENRGRGPVIEYGIPPQELNGAGAVTSQIDASYRPDMFGKLDSSITAVPNARWGYRLKKDSAILFQHCPYTHGKPSTTGYGLDGWGETNTLTIEVGLEYVDSGPFPAGFTGGIFKIGGSLTGNGLSETILYLEKGGGLGQWTLFITGADGTTGNASFYTNSMSGVIRMAICLDLRTSRTIYAFTGNSGGPLNQVTVNTSGTFFTTPGGITFRRNEHEPMLIGVTPIATDGRAPAQTPDYQSTMDWTLWGLAFSTSLRYANNGTGQAQTRVIAGTINDNYRYGLSDSTDTNIVAMLYPLDDPSDPNTGRQVSAFSRVVGFNRFEGYFTTGAMYNSTPPSGGGAFSNLILTGNGNRSPVISLGAFIDLDIVNCRISNGLVGIAMLRLIAAYTLRVRDCRISGCTEASVYGTWGVLQLDNIYIENVGRTPIQSYASNLTANRLFFAHMSLNTDAIVKIYGGTYGGIHAYSDLLIDAEGAACQSCVFYVERFSTGVTFVTDLRVKTVYLGTAADKVPIFDAHGYGDSSDNQIYIEASGLQPNGPAYGCVIRVDGPNVAGRIEAPRPDTGVDVISTGVAGAPVSVSVLHTVMQGPPRANPHVPGGTIIEPSRPIKGVPSRWVVVTAGTYGTTTEPEWVGLERLAFSPSDNYGFVTNYGYCSATRS